MTDKQIKAKLEYLRGELEAERLSYDDVFELMGLAKYIEPGDVLLLEAAGVEEGAPKCSRCGEYMRRDDNDNWVCESENIDEN